MGISRRTFFKSVLGAAGGAVVLAAAGSSKAGEGGAAPPDSFGCLMDTTLCVGCRKCEAACNESNKLPAPAVSFEEKSVLEAQRRPSADAFTVVNKYVVEGSKEPVYTKVQCMHCNDAACVSACIVGALRKDKTGAVTYNPDKCIGCRYCMVACPFGVPAYEYNNALAPRVRKCEFCVQRISKEGGIPACVKICPKEAITFGKRAELLTLAHEKIEGKGSDHREHANYIDYVYGENEVGGTGWIYVASVPFEKIGFLTLPKEAPPRLTEKIQHGVFKNFIPPLALYTILGAAMYLFKERDGKTDRKEGPR